MPSKELYRISGNSLPEIKQSLDFILSRISDRLDQIEGNRGTSTIIDGITIKTNEQIVHGINTSDEV